MANNKINLEVDLQANLGKVVEATKNLKLNQQQLERFQKYSQGAKLAFDAGDLKTFRTNFNNLVKLFKEAASVTGKLSDEIKKMTDRQTLLNQEINRLKNKKTDLEGSLTKDRKRITTSAAQRYATVDSDAKKVLNTEGALVSRNKIVELQKALSDFLTKTDKKLSQITNEDAKSLGFQDRNSAYAANRYVVAEGKEQARIQSELISTEEEIKAKEVEYTNLTNELNRMTVSASKGADAINKLYTEISKTGDVTNETITDVVNEEKLSKIDRKEATSGAPDVSSIEKQTSSLGKAFKQFTLYAVAIRAVKVALREATQTIKELDKYLTEQAMVTGMTREQTYGLVKSYQELALQVGATTKEIASVATEYMKQGKTIQDSLTLTRAAVSAAKVARVSVGDSVNYLTTALNGFRLSAEDAMKVSDKFAAVAAASATDYDELAIALSKVASQANLAGMSIDYTTALLTKGLETTREAPETMGTALKTIIARMRELSDYGETLEGDTDVNNVESQLAYVGIALKDANGELRSSEEVLDELGQKWDTLNKNQQAALAKALAGTRQQSRLIAMMDDYERVTELQQISQRSAGATAAQAGVYLEGIEAAMNKIQVAWEKIIMTISNSEIIIGVFDFIGNALDKLGEFLENTTAQTVLFSTLAVVGATILGQKIQENVLAKQTQKIENQSLIIKNKQAIISAKEEQIKLKQRVLDKEKIKTEKIKTLEALKRQKIELNNKVLSGKASAAEQSALVFIDQEIAAQEKEVNIATQEYEIEKNKYDVNVQSIKNLEFQNNLLQSQTGFINRIFGMTSKLQGLLYLFIPIYKTILFLQKLQNKEKREAYIQELKTQAAEAKGLKKKLLNAAAEMASSAGKIPFVGWAIGISILAAVGIAITATAVSANKYSKSAKGAAKSINTLSNEIYKLNEKANSINNITNSFDALDNKLIKTNADLKEMSSLLDQAADKLDEEEQKTYSGLTTDRQKREFLDTVEKNAREKANNKRREQINKIQRMSSSEREKFFNEKSNNAEIIQAQDAIFAINNNTVYEYIDSLKQQSEITKETASSVETLTQRILEEMSASEAWSYAQDKNGDKIKNLINTLKDLQIKAKDTDGILRDTNISEILISDDYSLKEQVKAYEEGVKELTSLGDKSILQSFENNFAQFKRFAEYEDPILDFIDLVDLTGDELSNLYSSWEKLNKKGVEISQEQFQNRFKQYLNVLTQTQGDAAIAAQTVYGEFIQSQNDLNAFISIYGDLVEVGILNMGQNIDKLKNTVNNFYEKALEWNTMSESDKSTFINDNAELFSSGDLLKAFETGDYERIQAALKENDALQKQIEQRRREVEQELKIEEAREGSDRNEAYISQLKSYLQYLNNTEELFQASLEVRKKQEEKQIDEYRSYLEEQQKALEDSLNKRREAYEKYFDDIKEQEDDEEYEEQADLLVKNLSKLGSSTNASAVQQTKELEQQLAELEKDRLKELRERAQEAVLEQMDDTLDEISDKFDKLLDSNQALLAAMKGELDNPIQFVTELLSNKIESGATALEMQDYVQSIQSTYGSVLGNDVDWDSFKIHEENNQLFLTVNGQEVALDTNNEQNLFQAIMKALREIGLR